MHHFHGLRRTFQSEHLGWLRVECIQSQFSTIAHLKDLPLVVFYLTIFSSPPKYFVLLFLFFLSFRPEKKESDSCRLGCTSYIFMAFKSRLRTRPAYRIPIPDPLWAFQISIGCILLHESDLFARHPRPIFTILPSQIRVVVNSPPGAKIHGVPLRNTS